MSKPRIGITANIEIMEAGAHPGMYRAFINYDYVEAVEDAGGVPVLLPVVSDLENVKIQMESLDGVILAGGYDIDPFLYKEEADSRPWVFIE